MCARNPRGRDVVSFYGGMRTVMAVVALMVVVTVVVAVVVQLEVVQNVSVAHVTSLDTLRGIVLKIGDVSLGDRCYFHKSY